MTNNLETHEVNSMKDLQKEFQKELAKLLKPLKSLVEIKQGDPDFPATTAKILSSLGDLSILKNDLEILFQMYLPTIQEGVASNSQAFKRYESAYLRSVQETGGIFREVGQGWRVGPLMLETQPALARARALYNREVLTDWVTIRDEAAFHALEQLGRGLLKQVEIPEDDLPDWFWVCFKKAVVEQSNTIDDQKCLIGTVYSEFSLRIAQHDGWRKQLGTLIKGGYPKWAFLYNLDRYRQLPRGAISSRRLALQTGSQQEVTKGLGITVGGLSPEDDYKTLCYIFPVLE